MPGDFYKGEKKKKKKGEGAKSISIGPVFVPPHLLPQKAKINFRKILQTEERYLPKSVEKASIGDKV